MGCNGRLWQVQGTYLNTEQEGGSKKEKGKEVNGKVLCFYSGESRRDDISTIVKTECTRVVRKEVNKAVYDDIA